MGESDLQASGETRRENAKVCPTSLNVIASAAKQSIAQQARKLDCFACARNDG